MALSEWELLERVKDVTFIPHSSGSYVSSTDLNLLQTDITDMDFTSELFASLNQPFAFPNPRELSKYLENDNQVAELGNVYVYVCLLYMFMYVNVCYMACVALAAKPGE